MEVHTQDFPARARRALADDALRQAISTSNKSFRRSRDIASAELPQWEELRTYGQGAKRRAVDHLSVALDAFRRHFTARGGHVHFAEDAADACARVRAIVDGRVSRKGPRRVVKSKSMVTEEIGLNADLETAGYDVVESDLGEYIVQLAGESPSHILAPAIHKSRRDVAELLHRHLGTDPNADIPTMTRAARTALRQKFLDAEVGISGGNFAIAESGTLVIVENEGNARLTTTLPPVHIAIVGIEKVLPRRRDLAPLLRLLCRSATGQQLGSYISFIGGPRQPDESDGPEEVHVIFLDAGRLDLWHDPKSREALHCIRCGACLNVCPVYERIGGHAYGWVYPGPIGSVITPRYVGLGEAKDLPHASSLCGRCGEVCPVKIPLPDLLLENRAQGVEAGAAPVADHLAMGGFARLARSPRLWRLGLALGRPIYRLLRRTPLARRGVLGAWSRARTLPPATAPTFRQRWRGSLRSAPGRTPS